MKNKKIMILLSALAFGALTGTLEAARGDGRSGGGRGGARMAGKSGGARMSGTRMSGTRMSGARMSGTRMGGQGRSARVARAGGARFGGRPGGPGRGQFAFRGRPGWRGGRWRGGRWARGPWRRGYGWGPGLALPGVAIGFDYYGDDYVTADYRDDMGYSFWYVTNNTSMPIKVRATGGSYFRLIPGESREIPRGASFSLKVKSADGQRMQFATHNHFVEIIESRRGTLRHNTWNE